LSSCNSTEAHNKRERGPGGTLQRQVVHPQSCALCMLARFLSRHSHSHARTIRIHMHELTPLCLHLVARCQWPLHNTQHHAPLQLAPSSSFEEQCCPRRHQRTVQTRHHWGSSLRSDIKVRLALNDPCSTPAQSPPLFHKLREPASSPSTICWVAAFESCCFSVEAHACMHTHVSR
jgi:hypothetical protein